MPDILANNLKQKNAMPEKIEPVVSLVEKKPTTTAFTRFVKTFVNTDPKAVAQKVYTDIIVPTIKRTLITSVTSGLSMMFNINVTPQIVDTVFGSNTPTSRIGYTGYSTMSAYQQPVQPQIVAPIPTAGIDRYMTFTYATEADASTIIESMAAMADTYDRAIAVGYLCQLAKQPDVTTDYNFGWTREMIARAKPVLNIDGTWMISWPRPIAINK